MLLYNTLSRRKEEFVPIKKSAVGLYSCGPTVYNYAHIGNLRTYLFVDTLKRALTFLGYKVKHIMNITDVGHLTSDADLGEDKLEKGAKREKKTVWQVAEFYTKAFKRDLKRLHILSPAKWTKATAHIKDQIRLIQVLEEKGFTYEGQKAVYFDTSKVPDYGKLAGLRLESQIAGAGERSGAAVEIDEDKRHPHDFVLWFKRVGKYKGHAMHWPSPWGDGFPGWHIECSAMSMKYLGETFDIHTGGVDHISIHHTNEIAQSESATGKPFVRFWIHGEFLTLGESEKMAKSGENFITLPTLIDRGFNPLSFRYLALTAHYRSPLTFTWEALTAAESGLKNLYYSLARPSTTAPLRRTHKQAVIDSYIGAFRNALGDDLNTSRALAIVWDAAKDSQLSSAAKKKLSRSFDEVLGLDLASVQPARIPKNILALIEMRETMRAGKNYRAADEVRKKVASLGYFVDDTPSGPVIMKR